MKIAIIGTRGIPNRYGGYEQFTEYISAGLSRKGHDITVYNPHTHPYKEKNWKGVTIIHRYDPENKIGSAGQFIYDLNCIRDAKKKDFDILLMLGYTSSSIWGSLYPKSPVIISNMDGLEWKRSKYSSMVRRFLKYAEKLAVKYSDYYIADSTAIQEYFMKTYQVEIEYIPYGAEILNNESPENLVAFNITPGNYYLLIARMEPENNIEMILDGFAASNTSKKFLVIGDTGNRFGKYLVNKFRDDGRIIFGGTVYDSKILHSLRFYSHLYFHGHSVGGTNPSLLEAMASRCIVATHENPFNKAVVGEDGYYFSNKEHVLSLVNSIDRGSIEERMITNNISKIRQTYNWDLIIDQYESFLTKCLKNR
jgi:glycosyltransferase involved in cell wall biosynthesis